MPNIFPARDRLFISNLAEELHLHLTWDEYDEDDQNLITWRFPGELDEPLPDSGDALEPEMEAEEDVWEDEDDEESRAAVDRVLAKYQKAKVMEEDKDGDFDARYEMSIQDKMDEWKRNYYKVGWQHAPCILDGSMSSFIGEAGDILRQPRRYACADIPIY